MNRLLSIELQKIWKNRASRVLTVSYFVVLSFITLIAFIKFDVGGAEISFAEQGIFNFPYIWHFNTYVAAMLKLFLAIIIVSMMANEYSYGTLKQNLIDGMSKKEFVLSKFITVLMFAACSTVFVFIMSLILGLIYSSYTEADIIFSDLEYLLAYFIKLTGFFSFCLFLGILVKRSAFALGFLFIWNIFEWIIMGVLQFWVIRDTETTSLITRFLPLESMSNLILEPLTRLTVIKAAQTTLGGAKNIKDYDVHFTSLLIVVAWTVIFVLMSYKLLKKRDL
ncbi:MAG TPA: ABC transporter permease [Flavobacterium sp.]|jgi:ABC-type transport system involved in multi-copper enzyme maturation permease subunit